MTQGTRNGKQRPQQENDSGTSINQILEMGQLAAQTLQSPVYNVAHQLAVNDIVAKWAATQPKERELRESLWHELQAHARAAQNLAGQVERAQQVAQEQEQMHSAERDEYLDQQGFGFDPNGIGPANYQ